MKVAEVMTRGVEPIPADTTIQEAATTMAEKDIGAVLIGTADTLEGILTDRDIILRIVVEGRDPVTVRVAEVMSSTLFTCRAEDDVAEAFQQMGGHQVRRLPVLDEDGKLAGIVTLSDLSRLHRDSQTMSEALREIAEPHRSRTAETATPEHADDA